MKYKDEINIVAIKNGSVMLNGMRKDFLVMQQEDQIVKQRLGKIIRYHKKIIMYSNLWIKGTLIILASLMLAKLYDVVALGYST